MGQLWGTDLQQLRPPAQPHIQEAEERPPSPHAPHWGRLQQSLRCGAPLWVRVQHGGQQRQQLRGKRCGAEGPHRDPIGTP